MCEVEYKNTYSGWRDQSSEMILETVKYEQNCINQHVTLLLHEHIGTATVLDITQHCTQIHQGGELVFTVIPQRFTSNRCSRAF